MLEDRFAMDSETDSTDGLGERSEVEHIHNVCVQTCSPEALTLNAVSLYFDDDNAYVPVLKEFSETTHDCECQVFNMGYEKGWIRDACITMGLTFVNVGDGHMKYGIRSLNAPNSVAFMEDKNAGCFIIVITNGHQITKDVHKKSGKHVKQAHYCRLVIKDTSKLMGGKSTMEARARAVRETYPKWWANVGEEVKEKTEYNNGWYYQRAEDSERFDKFVHYSKLDAFSQAMIMKYLDETAQSKGMTASGNSFAKSVCLSEGVSVKYAKDNYRNKFPPLDPVIQAKYEDGMVGGVVWGSTGWSKMKHGSKIDYKSSYPGGYWDMVLPSGNMHRVHPSDTELWERVMRGKFCRFYMVEFDFELKEGYLPCIGAGECSIEGTDIARGTRLKMKKGHRKAMITPDIYMDGIKAHYNISNVTIHYMDYYTPCFGYFRPAIREYFVEKEVNSGVIKETNKQCLNGGMHGKNITKQQRQHRLFDMDGKDPATGMWSKKVEIEELEGTGYPFYFGMYCMMGRRTQLLLDTAKIIEKGGKVYMTDTDSAITDLSETQLREIFGDYLIPQEVEDELKALKKATKEGRAKGEVKGWDMMNDDEKDDMISKIIGKFSMEKSGLTGVKCWGLKRYACYVGDEVVSTAFAGMTKRAGYKKQGDDWVRCEDLQKEVLSEAPLNGDYFQWKQNTLHKVSGRYGEPVGLTVKTARMEDVWWNEEDAQSMIAMKQLMRG